MPLILLAIVILFNWKLTLTDQFTWLEDPDRANQVLPWFQFQAIQWHGFRIPAWDPNAWTGQPLFGQGQPGAAYPFNWLLFLMPMSMGTISMVALNWYVVLTRYIAALASYALCRDLRCSRAASILGACVFALGGFVANTGWPQMVNGAVWAPLVFLFLFRVDRGGPHRVANSLLSGFFLGFAWLSGHHQAPLYITLAALAVWIRIALRGARADRTVIRLAALSLIVAVMAGAMQTFPMAEYGTRSVRWVGTDEPLSFDETTPYFIHEKYALKPSALLSIFLPFASEWNPFIGIAALSFVLLGAIMAWREKHARWLAAVAGGGMAFALGPNGLIEGVLYAIVPMVEKARSAGAATIVFGLGAAPLAAMGVDRLMTLGAATSMTTSITSRWPRRAARVLAAFSAVLVLASLFSFANGANPATADSRLLISAVAALAAAGLIAAWLGGAITPRGGAVAAIILVLFELSNVTNYALYQYGPNLQRTPLLHNMHQHNDIARFLAERGDSGRIEYNEADIPYNFGDYFGLETFQSYTASVTTNIWQHEISKPAVRDILGIRYSIAKQPTRPEQRLVFTGLSGLNVYENPTAFPRVWAVHESMQVPNGKVASAKLASADVDAHRQVLLVGSGSDRTALASCENSSEDKVSLSLHGSNRVAISAALACPGMVILSDTYYPGWYATVDGKSAPIEEADGIFRGVLVPAGQHTIEMKYRPASVIGGGVLTLLAGLIAAAAFLRAR